MRSLKDQFGAPSRLSVSVLYVATTPALDEGYALTALLHPELELVRQSAEVPIKQQIQRLVEEDEREFFTFFVDDIVIVRRFGLADHPFQLLRSRDELASISLRLNPRVDRCQPLGLRTGTPPLDADLTWDWRPASSRLRRLWGRLSGHPTPLGDWAGSMFLDGSVFRHRQFIEHFRTLPALDYVTRLESVMLHSPLPGARVACYPESRLVNLVMNRVDVHSGYPHGGGSVEELNTRFLAGERLAYAHLSFLDNRACHLVEAPRWQVRG